MARSSTQTTPESIVQALREFRAHIPLGPDGPAKAVKPSHRTPFHWPPHPISSDYHVLASDWTSESTIELHGESFAMRIARTPHGVFGRIASLWAEAMGATDQEMRAGLQRAAEPLFRRHFAIADALGQDARFEGHIRDLSPIGLTRLLYCTDRDVAHEAQVEIESHASLMIFGPALVDILRDTVHPYRRSAQWCVLDMFEDLPSFCRTDADLHDAVDAIKALIWNAEDDYARTIYKAGVVLGGHICTEPAADALIACIEAPSKIGRRSAIHAAFHLAEWMPARREEILETLKRAATSDPEPLLREFAACMVRDTGSNETEHAMEPLFPDEP